MTLPRIRKTKGQAKYGNRKVTIGGTTFDSAAEARRYSTLKAMAAAGIISDLKQQVRFVLVPCCKRSDGKTEREVAYVADFTYLREGVPVIEDVKSKPTRALPAYILKRKLMLYVHGITILETQ